MQMFRKYKHELTVFTLKLINIFRDKTRSGTSYVIGRTVAKCERNVIRQTFTRATQLHNHLENHSTSNAAVYEKYKVSP